MNKAEHNYGLHARFPKNCPDCASSTGLKMIGKGLRERIYCFDCGSESFDGKVFEAKEKKIGSIRIVKNPNFPSGTSLQAYIKTNRAELRKVFGNPNMGESGDGKSKGKEWNLWVGGKRVTIYDKREKDKKGTKYFNIGGSGKFGALLVAQALSIHRNERVRAKETVPQWLEDKRQYQQVKSIDEHPDLTYERAKEYEDNRGRYGAETFNVEFNEWADQELMSHGKDISFKDWAQDEGMKHGNTEITEWAQHEDESHNARYGAETGEDYVDYTMWIYTKSAGGLFNGEWEDGESEEQVVKEWKELVREAIEENGDDLITADLRKHSNYDEEGVSQSHEFLFEYEHGEDNLEDFESENWGGNPKGQLATALQKARDKAKKPKKPLKIEKLGADEHRFMIACGRCGWNFTDKYIKNNTDGNIRPMYGDHCSCGGMIKRYDFEPEPKPKGFFAKLLGKNAETSGQWEIGEQLEESQMNAENQNKDLLKWIEDYLWDNDKKGYQAYHAHRKSLGLGAEDKKRSGLLSDPFDELSLDSGDWKGIVAGFGVGLLALFGYSKLRK
jgi:hypothetical protein